MCYGYNRTQPLAGRRCQMKGGDSLLSTAFIFAQAAPSVSTFIHGLELPPSSTKHWTPASMTARLSLWLTAIFVSWVITTHPLRPASASHSSS